ncbi:MAG: hypothetical protein ACPHLK_09780 [Gammaproteobacteria bacterium]
MNWTSNDVCKLIESNEIKPNVLIQANKINTNKLIKELFLLACGAALSSMEKDNKESVLLRSYAKSIRQISKDYEHLFRRNSVNESKEQATHEEVTLLKEEEPTSLDRLQARIFYLITQYSQHPCTHLAANIVKELNNVCQHPHIELLPAQQYIYSQSINYWRSRLVNCSEPANRAELH